MKRLSDADFIRITGEFANSAQALLNATMLVNDDPIRADMVKHLEHEFDLLMAKEAQLQLMMKSKNYDREMVLMEMQECSKLANDLATRIREKLEPLSAFNGILPS